MDTDSRPKRRRDPFIALNTDTYRSATAPCIALRGMRDLAMRGAVQEITVAIAETGAPLPADDLVASRALRMDLRTWTAVKRQLIALGLLYPQDGGWMTVCGSAELERRSRRASDADTARRSRGIDVDTARHSGENANDNNGGCPPPPSSSPISKTHINHKRSTTGLGALTSQLVSDVMHTLVAEHVGDARARKLVAEFHAWPKSADARDADAMFSSFLRGRGVFISANAMRAARLA